jgi:hypothetical protein
MWARTFRDRLGSWVELRSCANQESLLLALERVNNFWFAAPWQPYFLHWDDHMTWPDPWQLLDDNIYCDVARGLGICYTLTMLEHIELEDFEFVSTKNSNLVLVNQGKYILNYAQDDIVNTNLECEKILHRLSRDDIQQKLK